MCSNWSFIGSPYHPDPFQEHAYSEECIHDKSIRDWWQSSDDALLNFLEKIWLNITFWEIVTNRSHLHDTRLSEKRHAYYEDCIYDKSIRGWWQSCDESMTGWSRWQTTNSLTPVLIFVIFRPNQNHFHFLLFSRFPPTFLLHYGCEKIYYEKSKIAEI